MANIGPPLLSTRLAFALAPFKRPAKAVGLAAGLDNVRPVRQPVQDRLAEPGVGEHLRPFRERQVGRNDHRRPLRAVGDHPYGRMLERATLRISLMPTMRFTDVDHLFQ